MMSNVGFNKNGEDMGGAGFNYVGSGQRGKKDKLTKKEIKQINRDIKKERLKDKNEPKQYIAVGVNRFLELMEMFPNADE